MTDQLDRIRSSMASTPDGPAAAAAFALIRTAISNAATTSAERPAPDEIIVALALTMIARRRRLARLLMGGLSDLAATAGLTVAERLTIGAGLSGLGALAVRLEDWRTARSLALLPMGHFGDDWELPYLISAARLDAARAKLLAKPDRPDVPLIEFARDAVMDLAPDLSPDLPADDERILNSICVFNALACLVQCAESGDQAIFPEFRRFEAPRTDRFFLQLVNDPEIREKILPGTGDARVAQLLNTVTSFASDYFWRYGGWREFGHKAVREFVATNTSAGS